jgi:5'-nucleotidase
VKRVRATNENVLLLDSGDIFQGTPYFNVFKGEIELRAMSDMGYDVATLGNHEFDNGVGGLVKVLPHPRFELVSANYQVTGSALEGWVRSYTIREMGGVRVGIFGLGIDFQGLVLSRHHKGISYHDPIEVALRTSEELRNRGCALVVCLSHLGYRYRSDRPSDTVLAQEVPEIDVILGGHSHTFMDQPDVYRAGETGFTVVHQVGWGGVRLGRIDVVFGLEAQPREWQSVDYRIDARMD